MPDRVEFFDITCPANTPPSAAVEVGFNYYPGVPRKVTIIIPDGHAGLTGIALGYGHQPVIPRTAGAFISSNDEHIPLDLTNYPAGPLWSAFVCNNDTQSHVWGVMLELDEIPAAPNLDNQTPLPATAIYQTGEQVMAQEQAHAAISLAE